MISLQECDTLVTEFLARGGRIRKIPDAQPKSAEEVVEYLRGVDIPVEPVGAKGSRGHRTYLCRGESMDLERLVAFANKHRRRRRLPPFQLKGRFSH